MRLSTIAVSAVLIGGLAGCGSDAGSDEPEPTTASTDDAGFTAEQREVADAAETYVAAIDAYSSGTLDTDLSVAMTADFVDFLRPLLDANLATELQVGESVVSPLEVTIDGETATYRGCLDESGTVTLPAGTPAGIEPPTPTGRGSEIVLDLAIEDGDWKVDDADGRDAEEVPCSTDR